MTLPRIAVRKEKGQLKETGDYTIQMRDGDKGLIFFICPHDGCGDKCHLPLSPPLKKGEAPTQNHGWQWNEETKTLSPSIQRMDKNCSHHFSLINGDWVP